MTHTILEYTIEDDSYSRVRIGSTPSGTIPLKIPDHRHRPLADITKVDHLSTFAEQQQPIKDLEEFTRGLMNSTRICSSVECNAYRVGLTCKGWPAHCQQAHEGTSRPPRQTGSRDQRWVHPERAAISAK